MAAPAALAYSIAALASLWGSATCDSVKGSTCRAYIRDRATPRTGKDGRVRTASAWTVRRELGVLQAALNHAHAEGLLIYPVKVTLPKAGEPRDRWLTRSEVAKLLRCAAPHVRRFILISIYTSRRAAAVLDLTWTRVDLEHGFIRFRAEGEAETNKRRGRVRIPRQLAAHLRRWRRMDTGTHVISFRGQRLASTKHGVAHAAERAGLEGVSAHVLKHTAVTWSIMNGLGVEDAAEFYDTTPATIRKHYWHHSPHHQERALEIVERRR